MPSADEDDADKIREDKEDPCRPPCKSSLRSFILTKSERLLTPKPSLRCPRSPVVMAVSQQHLRHLLTVLTDRNINIGRDDLEWAFESSQTNSQVVEWIDRDLGEETLLSKEELQLYSKLEANGTVRKLESSYDLSLIRPLTENHLREAIPALQDSTAVIEKQTETLRMQREALASMMHERNDMQASRAHESARTLRKQALESEHVGITTDDLAEEVSTRLSTVHQQLQASWASARQLISDVIRSDDRTLAQLEIHSQQLLDHEPERERLLERAKSLTNVFADLTAEKIRIKLDRIYLETEDRPLPKGAGQHLADDSFGFEALKQEVEVLYTEIESVAQMSARRAYEGPIMVQINKARAQEQVLILELADYVTSVLQHLTYKLQAILSRVDDCKSVDEIVRAMTPLVLSEVVGTPSEVLEPERTSGLTDPDLDGDSRDIEEQFLHRIGLSRSPPDHTDDTSLRFSQVLEHAAHLQSIGVNVETSIRADVLESTESALEAVEKLYHKIYSDSPDCATSLVDNRLRQDLETIEEQVHNVGERMSRIDLQILARKDVKHDQFVQRWSERGL